MNNNSCTGAGLWSIGHNVIIRTAHTQKKLFMISENYYLFILIRFVGQDICAALYFTVLSRIFPLSKKWSLCDLDISLGHTEMYNISINCTVPVTILTINHTEKTRAASYLVFSCSFQLSH